MRKLVELMHNILLQCNWRREISKEYEVKYDNLVKELMVELKKQHILEAREFLHYCNNYEEFYCIRDVIKDSLKPIYLLLGRRFMFKTLQVTFENRWNGLLYWLEAVMDPIRQKTIHPLIGYGYDCEALSNVIEELLADYTYRYSKTMEDFTRLFNIDLGGLKCLPPGSDILTLKSKAKKQKLIYVSFPDKKLPRAFTNSYKIELDIKDSDNDFFYLTEHCPINDFWINKLTFFDELEGIYNG